MSFQQFAKGKLAKELWAELSWADVVQAFQAATEAEKTHFLRALKTRRADLISRVLLEIVETKVGADVQAEYDAIIADGSLDSTEIQRLFK